MQWRNGMAAMALVLLGAADPPVPMPEKDDISFYANYDESAQSAPAGAPLGDWDADLKKTLTTLTPDRAADGLAAKYGLTRPEARTLTRLWLFTATDLWNKGREPGLQRRIRAENLALVADSERKPLALMVAAAGIGKTGSCSDGDFDALLAGSKDRIAEAWLIARGADCSAWYGRFAALAPDKAFPAMVALAETYFVTPASKLPLYAWLIEAVPAHVAEADRRPVTVLLARGYLGLLLSTGLGERAIAFVSGLAPDIREQVLAGGQAPGSFQADGLGFSMDGSKADDEERAGYAAALALAGRTAEAQAQFAALKSVPASRKALACAWNKPADRPPCDWQAAREAPDILVLDHFLNTRDADPYPIAETSFSSSVSDSHQGVLAELRCTVFAEPQYAEICGDGSSATARLARGEASGLDEGDGKREAAAAAAALEAAHLPGFDAARAGFSADLAKVAARAEPEDPNSYIPFRDRLAVEPITPPFAKLPLPAGARSGKDSAGWSKSFAPLPEGYAPVRVGRDGSRVAVISISGNYDPTGEISAGGYWVHLSTDGGASWQRPLYTGLSEHFPYVVRASSALPLFDADALTVEVEVALIDTRSISYPPVGLRTLRTEKNIYLRIPLAELARDSDGDGLTDIAARHLLLDAPSTSGTPFLVGSDAARCTGPAKPESQAMKALLTRLFRQQSRAIVEPVDRPKDEALSFAGWRGTAQSFDRPIFIQGEPADYACLDSDQLMIVYSPADIARIERFTPDFHAASLGRIVYNRARDRAWVTYSYGWAGGTVRMQRKGDGWEFDEIGSWIT